MLTEREKWLMRKAFFAAHTTSRNFRGWLNDEAADGVTVEMVLAKDAPREDTPETMRKEIERLRLAVDRAAEKLSNSPFHCVYSNDPVQECPAHDSTCFDHWRDWLMRERA